MPQEWPGIIISVQLKLLFCHFELSLFELILHVNKDLFWLSVEFWSRLDKNKK